jgi:lipopolysaccharide/colanic/teichoic acid biosynthesis glycosyltransferase
MALQKAVKRLIDIAIAALGLVVLAPVMAIIAVAIVADSGRPVFYRAERVGYRGRRLRMLKFRKMASGATGPALTVARDDRLTGVGRILVRARLDELPQLWHVLRGEMSLIGPRPEDPRFVARFAREYDDILRVRPGLTGWTQLAFANEAAVLASADPVRLYERAILPQKVELDRLYAARPTLAKDAHILWWTVLGVIGQRRVAVNRLSGAFTLRRRSTGWRWGRRSRSAGGPPVLPPFRPLPPAGDGRHPWAGARAVIVVTPPARTAPHLVVRAARPRRH